MAIEIQGRDAHEKETMPLTVGITKRNNAILAVVAKQIGEKKAYVVNKLIAEIKLSKDAQDEVTKLLEPAAEKPAEKPEKPATPLHERRPVPATV